MQLVFSGISAGGAGDAEPAAAAPATGKKGKQE
jgi:hypothetical protein